MFTEQEVYDMFMVLFMCVFENVQPEHGWVLRTAAAGVGKIVNQLIAQNIGEVSPMTAAASNPLQGVLGFFDAVKDKVWPAAPQTKECHPFLSRLAASGRPMRDLVACVIGLAVGSSVNYSQVVDLYLQPQYAADRAGFVKACKKGDT